MLKQLSLCLIALTLSLNTFSAENLSSFKKHFKFKKNDAGEVSYVRMNFSKSKLSLKPYLNQVKNDIKKEIERLRTKSGENELESLFTYLEDSSDKSHEADESIFVLRDTYRNLKGIDIDGVFATAQTKGVLKYFKVELEKALMLLDLSVVASTADARYFYKRNVTYEVVKRAIDFAKKKFDSIPVLNLVSYVMVEVHNLVLEQRLFHQNMLLHYLENIDETKIGLTRGEADRVFSSIYESRISAINFNESKLAVKTWQSYGLNKFYRDVRMANNKFRRSTRIYDEVGTRLNFAFFTAKEKGEVLVKNLFHSQHKFTTKMATAYNFSKPDQVRRFRSLLSLGKLGLGFLTIPGWLKGQVESFVDSFYVEQKRLEGALVAYFDINGNKEMSTRIRKQLINPYIYTE